MRRGTRAYDFRERRTFVNGNVDFNDRVYHELEIPYRWTNDGEPETKGLAGCDCDEVLSIRMLVVNGILHVQAGRFDKTYTSRMLHSGGLDVYETWTTLTSFPLMYFSHEHGIPVRYLNLVAEATSSFKASHDDQIDEKARSKNRYADWQTLQREISAYRVLCDEDNPNYNYSEIRTLSQAFKEKRDRLLEAEGYRSHGLTDDEERWRYPDIGHRYENTCGEVVFQNMNANRGTRWDARWFSDYYEEEP